MLVLLGLIVALTAIFYAGYRLRIVGFCSICAAVVITWAIGLVAIYLNYEWSNPTLVGLLMAASIGAYAERFGTKMGLLWKTTLALIGLPAVYFVIAKDIPWSLVLGIMTIILVLASFKRQARISNNDMFKNCC